MPCPNVAGFVERANQGFQAVPSGWMDAEQHDPGLFKRATPLDGNLPEVLIEG